MQPKYQMIYQILKDAILSQQYPIGAKLPSELMLAKQYQVSRITSKRALSELEADHLVTRQKGVGTIVIHNSVEQPTIKQEIIFVIPFANNNEFGDYTSGILEILNTTAYQLTTINNAVFKTLSLKRIQQAAGIIYYVENLAEELAIISQLYLNQIPLVLLDKFFDDFPLTFITADNFQGGQLATQKLLETSHQKVAFVTGSNGLKEASVRSRYFGYLAALKTKNIPAQLIALQTKQDNQQLMADIKNGMINAIVAENDVTAIQIMNHCHQQQLRIPETLSIVGFDNIQASQLSYPALSTIDQNFAKIGHTAMAALLKEITEGPSNKVNHITLPIKWVQRASN